MSGELERFEPSKQRGRLAYEHLHRYSICRDFVGGRRVLDLACGTGYGTHLLAQAAAEATGVDIDPEAIQTAAKRYKRKNLKYSVADCFDLPFEAGSFDVVVANEMVEHVVDQEKLISEAKRMLAADGLLLVSTPNKPVYNRYKEPNVFHVSELEIPEFRRLLEDQFKNVQFVGLRMALVSAGYSLAEGHRSSNLAAAKLYRGVFRDTKRPDVVNEDLQLDEPEYVLALCSDEPIEDAPNLSSIFFSSDDDLWSEHEKVMAWASQLHEEDELLRADLAKTRTAAETTAEALERTDREKGELKAILEHVEARNALAGGADQLGTPARLLGRLTGTQVEADQGSVIDALFSLNEQLALQRTQLNGLSDALARASALERELALSRDELARESDRVRNFQKQSESDRQELIAAKDAAAGLEQRVKQLEAQTAETAEALARKQQDLSASEARLAEAEGDAGAARDRISDLQEQLEKAARNHTEEIERQNGDLQNLRRDLEQSRAELAKLQTRLAEQQASRAADRTSTSSKANQAESANQVATALQRRRERLIATHRRVSTQISTASAEVRDRVQPAPPAPRKSALRMLIRRAPFSTVVFDPGWVEQQEPEAGRISLKSYLRDSSFHRIDPHPLFAANWYLDRNPDVADTGMSPLLHYLEHGWREGRDPHPYFANDWYLAKNPDVLEAGINPLEHYLTSGWTEGRWPNPLFDPERYLDHYPDVRASGSEPLTHFVAYGRSEDREVHSAIYGKEWRSLVPESEAPSLLDYFLSESASESSSAPARSETSLPTSDSGKQSSWPPAPLGDYWLPQKLRDFIIARHGESPIDIYWYLCSVMDFYADDPDDFAASDDCRRILSRVAMKSMERSRNQRGPLDATIIIPVYNNFIDTLLSIASLVEFETEASFEIIVADDRSNDATEQLIPKIGGVVRHLRQPENYGFVGNCNAAAAAAGGKTIVLLNNDTLVLPNWLDELIAPFRLDQQVGLVGSKLINWDGTLQEAGGIFWEDGSAWNFGRGGDPLDPQYNYLKDVDYCSGASIAVPASLWREIGGFDPAYSPAYCEDADLAFRLRADGHRTLYNPASEVIHHEGRSHGRDTSTGVKAYQVRNQERLYDRWRDVLEDVHFPNGEQVLRARDRSGGKPHILVIDHYVPKWDQDAGSRTMFHFIQALIAEGWAVSFWPDNLYLDPIYGPALQAMGVELLYGYPLVDNFGAFLEERRGLYDAVLLSRPHVSEKYIDALREKSDAKLLYYGHDIHFERMAAQREMNGSVEQSEVDEMKRQELAVCSACDVVLYPSEDEAKLMAGLVGTEVTCRRIPPYFFEEEDLAAAERALAQRPASDGPARLLFVGGFNHTPNIDAVIWFCREIAPILRDRGFDFHLDIVGSLPPPEVRGFAAKDVAILGFVSDDALLNLYRRATAVVAPLRFGAGVKGKVVEAMANGVSVVTTSVGAQGLPDTDTILLRADTAEEFADAVATATSPAVATEHAKAGIDYVRANFSGEAIGRLLRSVLPVAPAPEKRGTSSE